MKVPPKSISVNVVFTFNASIHWAKLSSVTRQPTHQRAISHCREQHITRRHTTFPQWIVAVQFTAQRCVVGTYFLNQHIQFKLFRAHRQTIRNGKWLIVENQFLKRSGCFEKKNVLFVWVMFYFKKNQFGKMITFTSRNIVYYLYSILI